MNTKELVQQGYDFFGKGDMEGFMGILHDDVTWVFPGESHPLSGSHKGKENLMMNMSKIPQLWENFAGVIPDFGLFCKLMDKLTQDYCCLFGLCLHIGLSWHFSKVSNILAVLPR